MYYIGIDPGASGGVAILDAEGVALKVAPYSSEADARNALEVVGDENAFALLEKVGAFPGQGVVSCFNFGLNFGIWRGLLAALYIPWELVSPRKWQALMGVLTPAGKELTHAEKKNLSKARAQALYPDLKVTHAVADALLIADFCRRTKSSREEAK